MASKSAARRAWRVARGKIDPRCDYCAVITSERLPENHPQRATVEDIVPLSKGGKNNRSNWALACSACNQAKGPEEHWPKRIVPVTPMDERRVAKVHDARRRARVAQISAKSREQDRERREDVERLARLARLPFTLYAPIPGVPDEAFR